MNNSMYRYFKRERKELHCEVVTPMFLGGADVKTAEFRAASIKGLLRYWWRALEAETNLEKLKKKETEIFGSVDKGGSFAIQIKHEPLNPSKDQFPNHPVPVAGNRFPVNILEYLAYGTYTYEKVKRRNVFTREYITPSTKFSLILRINKQGVEEEILTTIYVLSLFGGIGSRSRNGFGGFYILNKTHVFEVIQDSYSIDSPYSADNLKKFIKKGDARSYSSFSEETKVFRAKEVFDTWHQALAHVGSIYRGSRLKLEDKRHFEKRQYIGSPVVEKKITHSFLERHAKPYFIKISKEQGKYTGHILYLPSKYCDGLDEDRNGQPINHSEVNSKSLEIYSEFNKILASQMEIVL